MQIYLDRSGVVWDSLFMFIWDLKEEQRQQLFAYFLLTFLWLNVLCQWVIAWSKAQLFAVVKLL